MKCTCGGRMFDTNYHTRVCFDCGVETFAGYAPANQVYTPHGNRALPPTYSRLGRFRELIRRVFAIDNGPKATDPVWEYLKERSPFPNVAAIFHTLKASRLENKHYSNVHLFSKVFTTYEPHRFTSQELRCLVEYLCQLFENTLHKWNLNSMKTFFSYSWLIEQYLTHCKLHFFLQYVKQLQCPHRRKKYELKMSQLNDTLPENLDIVSHVRQNVPGDRFLSEIPVGGSHHN